MSHNPKDITNALALSKKKDKASSDAGYNYLIAKFQPLIHKLANSICPNCDKHDVTQSGNLAIVLAIETYVPKSSFNTWVYYKIRDQLQKQREIEFPVKISRYFLKKNCSASYISIDAVPVVGHCQYKKNLHEEIEETDKGKGSQGNQGYYDNPLTYLINKEQNYAVTQILRKIQKIFSTQHCQVFTDYYFFDMKYAELSKKYNLKQGQAKYMIHQVIEKLRYYYNK